MYLYAKKFTTQSKTHNGFRKTTEISFKIKFENIKNGSKDH